MAIEPTMGERIADAAAEWSTTGDVSGWGSEAAISAWERLLTLCDRADAAERLAVALTERKAAVAAWIAADANATPAASDRCRAADTEIESALAAWRAITWENQP